MDSMTRGYFAGLCVELGKLTKPYKRNFYDRNTRESRGLHEDLSHLLSSPKKSQAYDLTSTALAARDETTNYFAALPIFKFN